MVSAGMTTVVGQGLMWWHLTALNLVGQIILIIRLLGRTLGARHRTIQRIMASAWLPVQLPKLLADGYTDEAWMHTLVIMGSLGVLLAVSHVGKRLITLLRGYGSRSRRTLSKWWSRWRNQRWNRETPLGITIGTWNRYDWTAAMFFATLRVRQRITCPI